ncbi:MAG: RIP metalloprotease RseP [Planctomycetes bacterium]|nr:RIP metalloprotease RseP [Planctomycetota bacterium]
MLAIVNGAIVVLAIGILIFVHELGHFLVAKKVGIRVEAFSLGFGPKIWGFTRGDTVYKLCAIPLGGYVKMTGESPEDRPDQVRGDEFFAKTVSQRAWVVSAGVIMNLIFAVVAFPIAFAIGVPYETPVIGSVAPQSPAWIAGLESGDEILSIDGTEMLGFPDIRTTVAFSDAPLEVRFRRGDQVLEREIRPRYSDDAGIHVIGVGQEVGRPRIAPADRAPILAKVEDGLLAPRDVVVGIDGVPIDWTMANDLIVLAEDDQLALQIDRDGSRREVTVPLAFGEVDDESRPLLGVAPIVTTIAELGDAAGQSDLGRRLGLQPDDRIVELNGRAIRRSVDLAIALRLPAGDEAARGLGAVVERAGERIALGPVAWDGREGSFWGSVVLTSSGTRASVYYGSPAQRAGLRNGDRILAYGEMRFDGEKPGKWKDLYDAIRDAKEAPRRIEVARDGEVLVFEGVRPERPRPILLALSLEALPRMREVHRPFPSSISAGFTQTRNKLTDIFMTLRGLFTGGVAAENLGGIIMIARVSYTFAEQGLGKILFFMAILSLNLAILNILPIPVLDGGHLVFLALEKIKGGPIDERWMGYANIVGLVFILGLMLFVTYNDIMRLVAG